MNGLKTARVVVIDEDLAEVQALLRELARLGIPALHFTGEKADLPSDPLQGVRVVFLDLQLGAESNPNQFLPATINVLSRLLAPSAKGTGLVFWTKHEDLIAQTLARLKTSLPGFTPAFVGRLANKEALVRDGSKCMAALAQELRTRHARLTLWEWEQSVHDATTSVTELILGEAASAAQEETRSEVQIKNAAVADASEKLLKRQGDIARKGKGQHDEKALESLERLLAEANASLCAVAPADTRVDGELLRILGSLAVAAKDFAATSPAECLAFLGEALGALHADQLRWGAMISHPESQLARALFEDAFPATGARKGLTPARRAVLNGILLSAPASGTPSPVVPGNIYTAQGWSCEPSKEAPFPLESDLKGADSLLLEMLGKDDQLKLAGQAGDRVPCLVEITPACDHAQGQAAVARLIGGVMVLVDREKSIPSVEISKERVSFSRMVPFMQSNVHGASRVVGIFLNARRTHAVAEMQLRRCTPVLRLRTGLVVDLRSWWIGHAVRAGYIAV